MAEDLVLMQGYNLKHLSAVSIICVLGFAVNKEEKILLLLLYVSHTSEVPVLHIISGYSKHIENLIWPSVS
jgi:hypothetical protein